ncbi:MAG: hypothetical protein R3F61_32025 [Myxococcota bacterium]
MAVIWRVGPGVRADLVAYAGKNMNGKRQQVRFFPSGAQRGGWDGREVSSLVIRALPGTRVILAASDGDHWQQAAWRCIRVVSGHSLPSEKATGLPGVRVPDIDMMDAYDAKKTETDFQASYPYVDAVEQGSGWTFGRGGGLKNRIAMVLIEREDDVGRVPTAGETVARAILDTLHRTHPDALPGALEAAALALSHVLDGADADERIHDLRAAYEE